MSLISSINSYRNNYYSLDIRDCDIDIAGIFYYAIPDKKKSIQSIILGNWSEMLDFEGYVNKGDNEIMVTLKNLNKRKEVSWLDNAQWVDNNNIIYDPTDVYLKVGTKAWLKYHILALHEDCVSQYIDNFDKHELFMYAVENGRIPKVTSDIIPDDEDMVEAIPDDKNMNELSLSVTSDNIFSILTLLKPDKIDEKYNDNILLIACKRYSFQLVKFLVESCGIELKSVIKIGFSQGLLKGFKTIYLLNEITQGSSISEKTKLFNFMNKITSYALNKNPPVSLVNQDVFNNAKKYSDSVKNNFKPNIYLEKIEDDSNYYIISDEDGSYLQWLTYKISIMLPLPPRIDPSVTMMTVEEKPDVTYNDIGGCKEQIEKIREVVEMPMLHPERFV